MKGEDMNADQRYDSLSEAEHRALENQLGTWRLASVRHAKDGLRVTIAWWKAQITDVEYREWLALGIMEA